MAKYFPDLVPQRKARSEQAPQQRPAPEPPKSPAASPPRSVQAELDALWPGKWSRCFLPAGETTSIDRHRGTVASGPKAARAELAWDPRAQRRDRRVRAVPTPWPTAQAQPRTTGTGAGVLPERLSRSPESDRDRGVEVVVVRGPGAGCEADQRGRSTTTEEMPSTGVAPPAPPRLKASRSESKNRSPLPRRSPAARGRNVPVTGVRGVAEKVPAPARAGTRPG